MESCTFPVRKNGDSSTKMGQLPSIHNSTQSKIFRKVWPQLLSTPNKHNTTASIVIRTGTGDSSTRRGKWWCNPNTIQRGLFRKDWQPWRRTKGNGDTSMQRVTWSFLAYLNWLGSSVAALLRPQL